MSEKKRKARVVNGKLEIIDPRVKGGRYYRALPKNYRGEQGDVREAERKMMATAASMEENIEKGLARPIDAKKMSPIARESTGRAIATLERESEKKVPRKTREVMAKISSTVDRELDRVNGGGERSSVVDFAKGAVIEAAATAVGMVTTDMLLPMGTITGIAGGAIGSVFGPIGTATGLVTGVGVGIRESVKIGIRNKRGVREFLTKRFGGIKSEKDREAISSAVNVLVYAPIAYYAAINGAKYIRETVQNENKVKNVVVENVEKVTGADRDLKRADSRHPFFGGR